MHRQVTLDLSRYPSIFAHFLVCLSSLACPGSHVQHHAAGGFTITLPSGVTVHHAPCNSSRAIAARRGGTLVNFAIGKLRGQFSPVLTRHCQQGLSEMFRFTAAGKFTPSTKVPRECNHSWAAGLPLMRRPITPSKPCFYSLACKISTG